MDPPLALRARPYLSVNVHNAVCLSHEQSVVIEWTNDQINQYKPMEKSQTDPEVIKPVKP